MAKKTIRVSDMSGGEIMEGHGAYVRVTFTDARKGSYELDLTDEEAQEFGKKGRSVKRRGRKPAQQPEPQEV